MSAALQQSTLHVKRAGAADVCETHTMTFRLDQLRPGAVSLSCRAHVEERYPSVYHRGFGRDRDVRVTRVEFEDAPGIWKLLDLTDAQYEDLLVLVEAELDLASQPCCNGD